MLVYRHGVSDSDSLSKIESIPRHESTANVYMSGLSFETFQCGRLTGDCFGDKGLLYFVVRDDLRLEDAVACFVHPHE